MLRFRVLGTLEVEGDFGPVLVSGQRPRALLTSLLLRPGTVVPTDRLVEAIWGERLPEAPGNALQQVVLRLRGRLATGGPELSDVLSTAPAGYRLDVPLEAVDAELFERGYGQARVQAGADPHGALTLLTEALALWRGRAYEEFADSFAKHLQCASMSCELPPKRIA